MSKYELRSAKKEDLEFLFEVSTNDTIFSEIIQAKHIPELLKEEKQYQIFLNSPSYSK